MNNKSKLDKIVKKGGYVSVHSKDNVFTVLGFLKKECDVFVVREDSGKVFFKDCKSIYQAAKNSWWIWL